MTTCNRCGVSLYYPNNVIGKESVCTNCFRKEKEEMFEDIEQEKERADKYEALARERENQIDILSTTLAMYCSPYYDMQERAEKAEALVRELVKLLERIKYLSEEGFMIDETDDYALEQMINKAEEVLGDDV